MLGKKRRRLHPIYGPQRMWKWILVPIRSSEGSGEVGSVGLPSGLRVIGWDANPAEKYSVWAAREI